MVRFCRKAKHQLLKILTSGFSETETRVFAFNDSFQENMMTNRNLDMIDSTQGGKPL